MLSNALVAIATLALSQSAEVTTPALLVAPSNAVILESTDHHPGRFRIIFRITSSESVVPFATVQLGSQLSGSHSNSLLDWNAYLSNGSVCQADPDATTGIDVVRGNGGRVDSGLTRLYEMRSSRTDATTQRPAFVSTVFECDMAIAPGDVLAVQTTFYVFDGRNWPNAVFTFENLPFAE